MKILTIHPERCRGCTACVVACSMKHGGRARFESSRVHVWAWFSEGINVPITCYQCNEAACEKVCPTGAMRHTSPTLVEWDESRCIRCKLCTMACPFGNAMYDPGTNTIVKCDTCEGDPACAKQCPAHALEYVEEGELTTSRQKDYVIRLKETFEENPA